VGGRAHPRSPVPVRLVQCAWWQGVASLKTTLTLAIAWS
jgi:hypothetical protein